MDNFLKVDKAWLTNKQLTLIEKLIVAQIAEYTRNKKECYMTDKQFADAFGVNVQQVTRAMKKLADNGIITRNTNTVSNNGQSSKVRTLKAIVKNDYSFNEGIVKNDKRNNQNDTEGIVTSDYIKDNLKDNKKDNLENAKAEKRELEDLSEKELEQLNKDFKSHMLYKDIATKYNLKRATKEMCDSVDKLISTKVAERREAEQRKDAELTQQHQSLIAYIGGNSIKGLYKCLDYTGIDINTFTVFAEKHPEYNFYSYNAKKKEFGYHKNGYGNMVCNKSYPEYLSKGINAWLKNA